jgi:hypothetical protein
VAFTVFCLQLPVEIHKRFQSALLKMGDLELSVVLLLTMLLEASGELLTHHTTEAWSDTTPTMGWVWYTETMKSNNPGRILKGLDLHQHINKMCPLVVQHIPGGRNNTTD